MKSLFSVVAVFLEILLFYDVLKIEPIMSRNCRKWVKKGSTQRVRGGLIFPNESPLLPPCHVAFVTRGDGSRWRPSLELVRKIHNIILSIVYLCVLTTGQQVHTRQQTPITKMKNNKYENIV